WFAVVTTVVVSFVVGLPALRLRGEYLGIVTLVFGLVMQYSVLRSTVFSGGSAGIAVPRRVWGGRLSTDQAAYLVVSLLLLVVVAGMGHRLAVIVFALVLWVFPSFI